MELILALAIGLTVGLTVVLARLILDATPARTRITRARASAHGLADALVRVAVLSRIRPRPTHLPGARPESEPAAVANVGTTPNSRLTGFALRPFPSTSAAPSAEEPLSVTCLVCHRGHSIDARFCRWCGTPSSVWQ
jgi:hypothetical protein